MIVQERFPFVYCISVDDDAFFLRSNEEIEEFCANCGDLLEIPLWVTGATPSTITQRKLADAGMVALRMGIQTASPMFPGKECGDAFRMLFARNCRYEFVDKKCHTRLTKCRDDG